MLQREGLRDFIKVESEFHPWLHDHYERQIERWVETGQW
jgi:hypothetical protein